MSSSLSGSDQANSSRSHFYLYHCCSRLFRMGLFCALEAVLNPFSGFVVISYRCFPLFGCHFLGFYPVSICCRLQPVVFGFNRYRLIRSLCLLIGFFRDLFMLFRFYRGVIEVFCCTTSVVFLEGYDA